MSEKIGNWSGMERGIGVLLIAFGIIFHILISEIAASDIPYVIRGISVEIPMYGIGDWIGTELSDVLQNWWALHDAMNLSWLMIIMGVAVLFRNHYRE